MNIFKRKKYVIIGEEKGTQERINKLESLVAFLCRYNRDEVVIKEEDILTPYRCDYRRIKVVYIANDEVKAVSLGTHPNDETAKITLNKKYMAIAIIGKKHFLIDKHAGTVTDITEFYVGDETDNENCNDS